MNNKTLLEKVIESKFALLLGSIVTLIAVSPLLNPHKLHGFLFQSFFFVMVILGMLRILGAGKILFTVSGILAALAILFHYLSLRSPASMGLGAATSLSYVFCVGISLLFMLKKVFSEREVTADTIKGGISLYVLIGLWWETVYGAMWAFDRMAFSQPMGRRGAPDFFYFSFTTLTTLGYGDIIPVSDAAKMASMLEAMVGQIYLAVFVARLVGLHVAGSDRDS